MCVSCIIAIKIKHNISFLLIVLTRHMKKKGFMLLLFNTLFISLKFISVKAKGIRFKFLVKIKPIVKNYNICK